MSQQRLNVMIDSQRIATVAATLLYLADQAELSITISASSADDAKAKITEIEKLLAHSRYSKPTFVLAVGGDFFHSVRGASLHNIAGAAQENYAFKLRGGRQ